MLAQAPRLRGLPNRFTTEDRKDAELTTELKLARFPPRLDRYLAKESVFPSCMAGTAALVPELRLNGRLFPNAS